MGLFDGASGAGAGVHGRTSPSSPGRRCCSSSMRPAMSRSGAAVVSHDSAAFDPDVHVAGVILNRVGSEHHEALLRDAIEPLGVPVLGAIRRSERFHDARAPPRPGAGRERDGGGPRSARRPRGRVREQIELEAIGAARALRRPLHAAPWSAAPGSACAPPADEASGARGPRIAVAAARRSRSTTRENHELLLARGAELVPFDPADRRAPSRRHRRVAARGRLPRVYAAQLGANEILRERIARAVRGGLPTVAECGGLLYLCDRLDDAPMTGVLGASARMRGRLESRVPRGDGRDELADRRRRHHASRARVPLLHRRPSAARATRARRSARSRCLAANGPGPAFTLRARGRERPRALPRPPSARANCTCTAAFPEIADRFVAAAAPALARTEQPA